MDYEKAYEDMRGMYEKVLRLMDKVADTNRPIAVGAIGAVGERMRESLGRHDAEFGGER